MVFLRCIKRNPLVFLKYYGIVIIATIFVLGQVSNSIKIENHGDMEYFTNSTNYDYISDILWRYTRQTINNYGRCEIPINPRYTKYIILGENVTSYRSGDVVAQYSVFHINCSNGYSLNHGAPNASICINGVWTPPPSTCLRTCTSLMSTETTTVKCRYNNIFLDNCIKPVTGTIALLSCNPLYEEPSLDKNPIRVCNEGRWNPSIPQCYPSCGNKHPEGKTNIIGGNQVTLGDYPWQVGIYNSANQELICGGSIIEERVILSAAHCFTDYQGNVQPASNYLVAAGKYFRNYEDDRDLLAQYSTIFEIHVPERYKGILSQFALDIAILVLRDPFTLSESVQPVCVELNEESPQVRLSPNTLGVVTGWGYTEEGRELADVLKELVIPYISYNQCFDEVPDKFRRYITYDKICGGYLNNNMSVCGGDSGGGLVFKNILNNKYFVKGIVSTSPALTEDVLACDSNQYSTYTALDHHVSFVRDLVALNRIQKPVECALDDCADKIELESQNKTDRDKNLIPYRCRLPTMPQNGNYFHARNVTYTPGNYVSLATEIVLTCNDKYSIVPFGTNSFICIDTEKWRPPLKTCASDCPSLFSSTSTTTKCENNGKPLENCKNATDGTTALLTCNPFYENLNVEQNPIRLCKDGKWNASISECSPICGQSSQNSNYPWHVGIYNDEKQLICGGTIITPNIILSAAHCVRYNDGNETKKDYYVGAGKYYHEYDDVRDQYAQYSQIQKIHVPERYRGITTNLAFNIAALVLKNPFSFSMAVQPVCLELPVEIFENRFLLHNGSIGIVTGWGFIKPEGPLSEELKELILPYVPLVKCLNEVPESFVRFVTTDKLCGGYLNNGTGVCIGDSGGGFIFKNPLNDKHYIKGILSTGPATEGHCDINQYATYTSISSQIDFIQDIIANNGVQKYI